MGKRRGAPHGKKDFFAAVLEKKFLLNQKIKNSGGRGSSEWPQEWKRKTLGNKLETGKHQGKFAPCWERGKGGIEDFPNHSKKHKGSEKKTMTWGWVPAARKKRIGPDRRTNKEKRKTRVGGSQNVVLKGKGAMKFNDGGREVGAPRQKKRKPETQWGNGKEKNTTKGKEGGRWLPCEKKKATTGGKEEN